MEERYIDFPGASGQKYRYWVYMLGSRFERAPGNYIFTRAEAGGMTPVHIGETADLRERFEGHHMMPCIRRNRATHICVHQSPASGTTRRREMNYLIDYWHPVCND